MAMIRGKIESPREIIPNYVWSGKPAPVHRCPHCNKWFDDKTGKELKVETFEEAFAEYLECNHIGGEHE